MATNCKQQSRSLNALLVLMNCCLVIKRNAQRFSRSLFVLLNPIRHSLYFHLKVLRQTNSKNLYSSK